MTCNIVFSETGRKALGWFIIFISLILFALGFVFISIGIYIGNQIYVFRTVLEGYAASTLCLMLMVVGSLLSVLYALGGKMVHACLTPERRDGYNYKFILYMFIIFILLWVELSASILCLREKTVLRRTFSKGLKSAMEKYKTGGKHKKTLDTIQIEYQCCGSKGYQDWLSVAWAQAKYMQTGTRYVRMHKDTSELFRPPCSNTCIEGVASTQHRH